MARFINLNPEGCYNIVSGSTGESLSEGIHGADAMGEDWEPGDKAYEVAVKDVAPCMWLHNEPGLADIADLLVLASPGRKTKARKVDVNILPSTERRIRLVIATLRGVAYDEKHDTLRVNRRQRRGLDRYFGRWMWCEGPDADRVTHASKLVWLEIVG